MPRGRTQVRWKSLELTLGPHGQFQEKFLWRSATILPASVVSSVEFGLTRGDDEHEEIENHDPMREGSSRDGTPEIDASDVRPVHVEDEFDTMPARIPAVRRALWSLDGSFFSSRGSCCTDLSEGGVDLEEHVARASSFSQNNGGGVLERVHHQQGERKSSPFSWRTQPQVRYFAFMGVAHIAWRLLAHQATSSL